MREEVKQRALDFMAGYKSGQAGTPPGQTFLGYFFNDWNEEDPLPSEEVMNEVYAAMLDAAREAAQA